MTQDPNFFLLIGEQVKDEYGHIVGKVASLAVRPNGRVDSVYVEHGDGRFAKYPSGNLKVEGSEILLFSKLKVEMSALCDQIPLVWRKDQALKGLVEKKKISPEIYEGMHENFVGVLNQLKSEAQTLIAQINEESAKCSKEIEELNYALVHLELEHEIGKIDEQCYQMAFTALQSFRKKTDAEKDDLEAARTKLSNILLGEQALQTEKEVQEELPVESEADASVLRSPGLPEPPVVVHVKEAGECNI